MQLIRKLKENRDSDSYPFHMPGHKRRLSNDDLLSEIYGIDVTEIDGFDNLHNAKGIIKEAEDRASKLFGSYRTHFLVNGSTGGILAAVCAAVTKNDSLLIAANCHRSVYNAAALSGADLYVMTPGEEMRFGICGGVSAEDVDKALSEIKGTPRTAVVITSPTYEGVVSDVRSIADVCRRHGAYLIVDAAHGAHFGLSDHFPESPVLYADAVVTSVHKTLPSMTQTALIHISKECDFADRIERQLSVFMTSSPSYVLMASIDSMTELMTDRGRELFDAYSGRLDKFYDRIKGLRNLTYLSKETLSCKGSYDLDRGKIVIKDMGGRITGKELSDLLAEKYGIIPEMSSSGYVILMTSVADDDEGFERLAKALISIDKMPGAGDGSRPEEIRSFGKIIPVRKVGTLSSIGFSDETIRVLIDDSEGKIAADFVTIYPPGIPVILPQQTITKEMIVTVTNALCEDRDVIGINSDKEITVWERSST